VRSILFDQADIPGASGREGSGAEQRAPRVDHHCHMEVLVGVHTDYDAAWRRRFLVFAHGFVLPLMRRRPKDQQGVGRRSGL
jgi:hypothetical protein